MKIKNPVLHVPAASPQRAREHFAQRLHFETDCWDVHASQDLVPRGFVLLDVRSQELFEGGHLPGAVNLPHWQMTAAALEPYAPDTLFVVYCAGPHCNGANKAALRLSQLERPVKEMIGGVTGWIDEGFTLVTS